TIPRGSVAAATPQCYLGFASPNSAGEFMPRFPCEGPRLHEVEARMTPQNALHSLFDEAAFPAQRRGMANRADALSSHPVMAAGLYARGKTPIIARLSDRTLNVRARRKFNVHAHAYRCAPPGRNPGCRRQR